MRNPAQGELSMRLPSCFLFTSLLFVVSCGDRDIDRLRIENAELRKQLEDLRRSSNSNEAQKSSEDSEVQTISVGAEARMDSNPGLRFKFLKWRESPIAVEGPFSGNEYCTYSAKPGMKFVVMDYKVRNADVRQHYVSQIGAAYVKTSKGYEHTKFDHPGCNSDAAKTPCRARKSTPHEISELVASTITKSKLLPEE